MASFRRSCVNWSSSQIINFLSPGRADSYYITQPRYIYIALYCIILRECVRERGLMEIMHRRIMGRPNDRY